MHFRPTVLFIFFALIHASYGIHIESSRMLGTGYVTKLGNISINNLGGSSFYVNADLSSHYNDASESENFDSSRVYMRIALYTSQTMLTEASCYLGFEPYTCSDYGCTAYTSSSSTPVFPYFQVTEGYYADATVILDYSNWELKTNATIATSCSPTNTSYGQEIYGILGLGRNGTQANFIGSSPVFSVFLDLTHGQPTTLLFSSNTNITSISTLIGSVATNADWNILPSPVQISCGNYSATETLGAIFDIHTYGIGLPLTVFNEIMQALQSLGFLNCQNNTESPQCWNYQQGNASLPTIKLTVQGQEIQLPPDLYVFDVTDSPMTLTLKAVDPSLIGDNYVTDAYQNYIIFGNVFLSYYYTEYTDTGDSYTVTLYKPHFTTPEPVEPPAWPWIVGGIFGLIVIVGVVLFFIKRRRNKRIRDKTQKNKDPNTALMADSKESDLNYGSYHQRDHMTQKYGHESWISPDVPQSG